MRRQIWRTLQGPLPTLNRISQRERSHLLTGRNDMPQDRSIEAHHILCRVPRLNSLQSLKEFLEYKIFVCKRLSWASCWAGQIVVPSVVRGSSSPSLMTASACMNVLPWIKPWPTDATPHVIVIALSSHGSLPLWASLSCSSTPPTHVTSCTILTFH